MLSEKPTLFWSILAGLSFFISGKHLWNGETRGTFSLPVIVLGILNLLWCLGTFLAYFMEEDGFY